MNSQCILAKGDRGGADNTCHHLRTEDQEETQTIIEQHHLCRGGAKNGCSGTSKTKSEGWDEADLARKLQLPEMILSTSLWPDIIMWSYEGKKVILVEVTGEGLWRSGKKEKNNKNKTRINSWSKIAETKGGQCDYSQWRDVEDSLLNLWGVSRHKPQQEDRREKLPSEGWEKRQKGLPVGCGIRGRTFAGSLEERGRDLATLCWPTNWRVL